VKIRIESNEANRYSHDEVQMEISVLTTVHELSAAVREELGL
jgi:hypothetical protein